MTDLTVPFEKAAVTSLRAGDEVRITGKLLVARDAAHHRFMEAISACTPLPVSLVGQVIYYMGPTPAPKGKVIGSCGPTTSTRMDDMTVPLFKLGLRGTMGKGKRSPEVRAACRKFGAIYLITYGGCGAWLQSFVRESRVAAYEDLGPEAVLELAVDKFPAIVGIDVLGGDFYEQREKLYNTHSRGNKRQAST